MKRAPLCALSTVPATLLLAAGCGSQQDVLSPHSKAARGIDSLWWDMLAGSTLAFAIVALILVAAWVRRTRPGIPGVEDGDRAALGVVIVLGLVVPVGVLSALFLFSDIFLIRDTTASDGFGVCRAEAETDRFA